MGMCVVHIRSLCRLLGPARETRQFATNQCVYMHIYVLYPGKGDNMYG